MIFNNLTVWNLKMYTLNIIRYKAKLTASANGVLVIKYYSYLKQIIFNNTVKHIYSIFKY